MNLKDRLIRLGSQEPDLRKHLKPVLDKISGRRLLDVRDPIDDWERELYEALKKEMPGYKIQLMGEDPSVARRSQRAGIQITDMSSPQSPYKLWMRSKTEGTRGRAGSNDKYPIRNPSGDPRKLAEIVADEIGLPFEEQLEKDLRED